MLKVTTTEYFKIQGVNIFESGEDEDGNKLYSMTVNANVYSDAEKTTFIRNVSYEFTGLASTQLSLENSYYLLATKFQNVESI